MNEKLAKMKANVTGKDFTNCESFAKLNFKECAYKAISSVSVRDMQNKSKIRKQR